VTVTFSPHFSELHHEYIFVEAGKTFPRLQRNVMKFSLINYGSNVPREFYCVYYVLWEQGSHPPEGNARSALRRKCIKIYAEHAS